MDAVRALKVLLLGWILLLTFAARAESEEMTGTSVDSISHELGQSMVFSFDGRWSMEMGGAGFGEGKDLGNAAYFILKPDFDFKFASWLNAKVDPELDLYTSQVEERYETDDYQNRIRLVNAYLNLKPIDDVEFHGGALAQGFLEAPMMVSNRRAFLGGQILWQHRFGDTKVGAVGQQVIPTSYSLDTEREDKEAIPLFTTESLNAEGRAFQLIDWRTVVGHFNWSDTPDKVAFQSAQDGNSVIGDVAPGAHLRYAFDGFFGSVDGCLCFGEFPFQPLVNYQRVSNTQAASGYGDAQAAGIGARYKLGDRVFQIMYHRYFIEKDATVAVYNRSGLGGTNREGDEVNLRLDFKDHKFAIIGEWVNALPIRENGIQHTFTSYYLGLETHYVSF